MGLDKDTEKKILVLCQGGKPPPFQIQSGACTEGLEVAQSDVNPEPPTAGMEPSWQEPSLWSSLQCDVKKAEH